MTEQTERQDSGDELAFEEEVEQPSSEELPEKYKGKSIADIARMHQEAESLIGRQSREVGELRKAVDQVIKAQLEQAPKDDADEVDFYTDPEKAIARAIERNPLVRDAQNASTEFKRTTALNTLQSKHTDMKEILQDPAFGEWIGKSQIRTELFKRADANFDYAAADELFSLWKERRDTARVAANTEQQQRKQGVKAASTGSARGSGGSTRKIYRRADIVNLMKNDPSRYQALLPEIEQAYRENRVK